MISIRKLFNIHNITIVPVRTLVKKPPLPEGGIKYYGFTYYPRRPDFKDPPYKPTKLFLIRRLCKMKGLNPVEKRSLELLNIDGEVHLDQHVSIVKNIPEVNARLWKVKHLVEIVPIKCMNGIPEDGNITGTFLRDNGEFVYSENLKVDPERIKATENFIRDKNKMDPQYMRNYLRLKWESPLSGDI